MTATGSTRYVQPLLILRSGTHQDAVRAATTASVATYFAQPEHLHWQPWLAQSFAKSVRRARPVEFQAATALDAVTVRSGDAAAHGFAPMTYDQMPREISRTQVSGTDYPRTDWPTSPADGPLILINSSLQMSTGKTAAQTAHGLFTWMLRLTDTDRRTWHANGMPYHIRDAEKAQFDAACARAAVTINDSGFTEIAQGSTTVAVLD